MNGVVVYADVFDVPDVMLLDDADSIVDAAVKACRLGMATVLQTHYHRFHPQGLTVFCLLAESHAAIHTYPEESAYMVDVFTCGEMTNARLIAESTVSQLGGNARFVELQRGGRRAVA